MPDPPGHPSHAVLTLLLPLVLATSLTWCARWSDCGPWLP